MNRIVILAAVALAGCSSVTPDQKAALVASGTAAATTLAAVAAANNKSAAQIIADGQLICAVGPGFVAALGYNVVGAPQQAMQAACAALGGVGAALPPTVAPASVPAVAVVLKPA